MKTIKNAKTEISSNVGVLDRNELFKLILNEPTQQGINVNNMRERFRILDAIDKADGGDIKLEDNDFNTLKRMFDAYGFVKPHKHILELADHLEEVSKQKK